MITTVLFDAGGVLLDESAVEKAIAERITTHLNVIDSSFSRETYVNKCEEAVQLYVPNVYKYVVWQTCRSDEEVYWAVWRKIISGYDQMLEEYLRLHPEIKEPLQELATSYKLNIAGQYGKILLRILDCEKLLPLFEHNLTQADFTLTKPDPRYYEQILKAISKRPEECIMVGDRIDKDVIPAKQVGMKAIRYVTGLHVNQRPRTLDEYPDAEITSLKQLPDTVKQLTATA